MKSGPLDPLFQDCRLALLLIPEPQQVGQQACDIPAGADRAKGAQRRFIGAGIEQPPQPLSKWPFAKIGEPDPAACRLDQLPLV